MGSYSRGVPRHTVRDRADAPGGWRFDHLDLIGSPVLPSPYSAAYAAAKGGVFSLTRAAALQLGRDERVNCICPGIVNTTDWGALPELSDSAAMAQALDHRRRSRGSAGRRISR